MDIKLIREQKGFTSCQVAELAKLSPAMYCMVERGQRHPSPAAAERIGRVLDLTKEQLWELVTQ